MTLLVTPKMSPELAARVAASVRGGRAARGARRLSHARGALRMVVLAVIAGSVSLFVLARQSARERFEGDRADLLARIDRQAAALSELEKAAPARIQSWLERCAGQYAGDWVAEELRPPGALGAAFERSTVYVRGPLASFRTSSGLSDAAAASFKDAFPRCLLEPPASRSEKVLLAGARGSSEALHLRPDAGAPAFEARRNVDGGDLVSSSRLGKVERLYPALAALPFLAREWRARVVEASDPRDLDKLRRVFERVPFDAAKRAVSSELLLFAMDEPGDTTGPTELDGERPHHVRIGLVELATSKLLLRLRRRVDPRWLSAPVRAEFASVIDSCALAFDVHRDIASSALAEK
jgi:hypothetical protein